MTATGSHRRHPKRYVARRVGAKPWQRTAAVGALASSALALVGLVVLVLYRPLHALGVVAIAVLFLAACFVALTSTGVRRLVVTAAAAVSGLGLVVSVLFWSPDPGEPDVLPVAVLALFVAGAALQRYALVLPPPSGPRLFEVTPGRRATNRPVLIVNLRSGGGKAETFDIPGRCAEHGIDVVVLEPGADLVELATDAVGRGADALGMAGGDGSLGVVATVAAEHDLPFVCVPVGTRNHFALDLGLDRADPTQALSSFLSGDERRIDYALVNDRVFVNNVSLGVYAAVVAQETYRDAKLETVTQVLPELWEAGGPWFDLHFDVPDHGRLQQAAVLQVSNNPYAPAEVGRRLRLDGGELGMLTADPQDLGELMRLAMLAAAGRAERSPALWSWSAPTFVVESGQETLAVGLDGETVSLATPLEFRIVPQGLRVLVPQGTLVGLAEQRVGDGTAASLFSVALGLPHEIDDD
jgi:diacylglycerol kinase family enzyme